MGDAAEDMIDGSCCQMCGEWMDGVIGGEEAPGFPQTCPSCLLCDGIESEDNDEKS